MNDTARRPNFLRFAAGKLRAGEVALRGVRGRERISSLYAYDLLLTRDSGPLSNDEIDGLFSVPCAISLDDGPGSVVRGLLESIRKIDVGPGTSAAYVARMVPTAWLLTLAKTNRIFKDLSVLEIVASVLAQYGLQPERDYHILAHAKSPKREYVVQYEESDWSFLERWLEHEGLYYWFEQGAGREVLVISDSGEDATPIAPPSVVRYRWKNHVAPGGEHGVTDWEFCQRRSVARVAVFDYNYRTPQVRLVASATADETTGFGTSMSYGDHFKTVDEGKALAKVRAERVACERRVYTAQTDCPRFRAGHAFALEDHDDAETNGRYLITETETRVGQPLDGSGEEFQPHATTFRAIPQAVQFRPERAAPWPSIHGLMHGHIAADGSGALAEIDDLGRYKVSLPFDSGNAKGASVSRWIRMAQPHAGRGYGSHMPLHKGTEVLVAFIDGDPDRPIIVGSVPNALTASPSSKGNATQSVIRTASGIHLELEDLATGGTTAQGGKR
jgi:type VI secretion system secreted protein VgrG